MFILMVDLLFKTEYRSSNTCLSLITRIIFSMFAVASGLSATISLFSAFFAINSTSNPHDLSYASMYSLALNIEKPGDLSINQDAKEFKPIRDALAHTARLTEEAKVKLTSVFNNIKYRLINLLQQNKISSSK